MAPNKTLSIALSDPNATFSYVRKQQNAVNATATFRVALSDGRLVTRTANIVVRPDSEHYYAFLARLFLA